ncbi:hypothetical protein V9T40_004175 [Parthenolecanium corni]|uniref:Uncharacterized protein n=1 Tax=Parthenolecanium corni TaxID=536013 RepID=A0AAN9YAI7_9HEMI
MGKIKKSAGGAAGAEVTMTSKENVKSANVIRSDLPDAGISGNAFCTCQPGQEVLFAAQLPKARRALTKPFRVLIYLTRERRISAHCPSPRYQLSVSQRMIRPSSSTTALASSSSSPSCREVTLFDSKHIDAPSRCSQLVQELQIHSSAEDCEEQSCVRVYPEFKMSFTVFPVSDCFFDPLSTAREKRYAHKKFHNHLTGIEKSKTGFHMSFCLTF